MVTDARATCVFPDERPQQNLKSDVLVVGDGGGGLNFAGTPRLNLEEWAVLLDSICGGEHQVSDPNAFAAWMRR